MNHSDSKWQTTVWLLKLDFGTKFNDITVSEKRQDIKRYRVNKVL